MGGHNFAVVAVAGFFWCCFAAFMPAVGAAETITVYVRVDSEASGFEGYRAMDGNPATMWHTDWILEEPPHPHQIDVDLTKSFEIRGFVYLPRQGGGNGTIVNYECYVAETPESLTTPVARGSFTNSAGENTVLFSSPIRGRYFRLKALSEVSGRPWTSIAELKLLVDGVTFRAKPEFEREFIRPDGSPMDDAEIEFQLLEIDLRRRAYFEKVASEVFHPQSLVWPTDRDPVDIVLRRTQALLANLEATFGLQLKEYGQKLAELAQRETSTPVEDRAARLALLRELRSLRRKIAFSNPLLDFNSLVILKRHLAHYNHMCDQYYGINAEPGGGIFIVEDCFGPEPRVRNLLSNSVVERGRLAGQKLEGGAFLSPDLSFDARRVAFAYVECRGDKEHRFHTDPSRGHWHEGRCYHIFVVNVDGSGLVQLTDGTWNDFDPCWLPNGRIAFISERRGGYLRCGRVCPTYTLFDMAADGSQMRCLSYHETNEWNPSVTHDGRILYTRWDYVDRHGVTAHLPWVTTLDGRDSRAVHGNFAPRHLRPDMELNCRAIPGSVKFVATAAPHHGQAFGSLVVIDPRFVDDDAMGPIRRLTPEVGFPESQGGSQGYGTAWPLSEKYYLCAFDPGMVHRKIFEREGYYRGNYGIYLVDAFGNKELIYRDPEISCQNPIPLQPRPLPLLVPEQVPAQDAPQFFVSPSKPGEPPQEATISVINVYDSKYSWPAGTRIVALRVIQILPMTVPSGAPPHEVGLRLPHAADSVMLARYVLGTVPVEADGSAHFTVPAQKEIFFQALDERGLAVQSMRSATYLKPGEHLVCRGCHEVRHEAPPIIAGLPTALRRPASRLEPELSDGVNPFSYARLVQPVLDRRCVPCHTEKANEAINLEREPLERKWFASYVNLATKFGFWDYQHAYRTQPGQFGARASKLLPLLENGHYGVELTPEEFRRLTLWLDLCSIFYGVYEKEGGERQLAGEVVYPTLE